MYQLVPEYIFELEICDMTPSGDKKTLIEAEEEKLFNYSFFPLEKFMVQQKSKLIQHLNNLSEIEEKIKRLKN